LFAIIRPRVVRTYLDTLRTGRLRECVGELVVVRLRVPQLDAYLEFLATRSVRLDYSLPVEYT
jgi:hypothetical protein